MIDGKSYSSTQVNLPAHIAKHVKAAGLRIPHAKLAADGRENEPHVTVKYGLHDDHPDAVRKVLKGEPPIHVKLGKASIFPDSGSGDVLKVDVHSPDLHRLNGKLAAALPHSDSHPVYTPHVTIAYLKPGEGAKHVGKPIPGVSGQSMKMHHVVFSNKAGEHTMIPLDTPLMKKRAA